MQSQIIKEAMPGSIKKAGHFLKFMRKVIRSIKDELKGIEEPKITTPLALLTKMQKEHYIDQRPMKACKERLASLLNTLEIENIVEYSSLNLIADFSTLIATYYNGFSMIIEPFPEENIHTPDPLLQLYCLDASIATKPIFEKFKNAKNL